MKKAIKAVSVSQFLTPRFKVRQRHIRPVVLLCLAVVMLGLSALTPAFGQQIINIAVVCNNGNSPNLPVYDGQGVLGGPSDTLWNAFPNTVSSMSGLLDSQSNPTTVGIAISSPTSSDGGVGSWSNAGGNNAGAGPVALLINYRFVGNGTIAVVLTGLNPDATYDLVCYSAGDSSGQGGTFAGALTGSTTGNTRESFVRGANYVENPNVAPDASGQIKFTITGGTAPFNGLQIAENIPNLKVPEITNQPVSQVIRQGFPATLTVGVDSGSQVPYFQWYLGASPIAGATNATYNIAAISADQAGSYTVVVTNKSGSVTSSPAVLTVDVTTTTSMFVGGSIGQGLDLQGGNYRIAACFFDPADTLTIQSVTFANGSSFFTSSYAPVEGNVAPNFGSDPDNLNLSLLANNTADSYYSSSPLTLSLPTVNGTTYKLQLLFHDNVNTGPGQQKLQVMIGSEVVEQSLDVAGMGGGGTRPAGVVISYYFTGTGNDLPISISNSVPLIGYAILNGLTLQAISSTPQVPYFILTPQNQTAQQGAAATISALAGGSIPPFAYQWYFEDSPINGATNASLTIPNVQPGNAGTYTVVAANAAGAVTNSAILTVSDNVLIGLSTGPAPGQGMILQGNFVLAEYYGVSGPDRPISGTVFSYSTRPTATASSQGNTPNFGSNADEQNLGNIAANSVYGGMSVSYPTTAGINYRMQIILHDNYFTTPNSRVFGINAASGPDGSISTVLASSVDLAALGAGGNAATNVVITYYFTGDDNPVTLRFVNLVNNPILCAVTLEDLSTAVAPSNLVPFGTQSIYPGTSLQLIDHVNGQQLTYQWQREAGGVFVNINGATNYILTLANIQTADITNYQAIARNALGAATNVATLTVRVLPPPVDQWLTGDQSFADKANYYVGQMTGTSYMWTNDVPPGKSGYALYFGGNNTVMAITNTADTAENPGYQPTFDTGLQNAFSVACWAKGMPGNWNAWVSKGGEGSSGWQLRQQSMNSVGCFTVRAATGGGDRGASVKTDDGQWHFYVGTYDSVAGLQSIYVDGVLAGQSSVGAINLAPYSWLVIGGRNRGDNPDASFNIDATSNNTRIYEVSIYNYALAPADVQFLAKTTPSEPADNTLTYTANGSELVLSWPAGGTLLQATNLTGPWVPVAGAASPYTNSVTAAPQMFFRVSNP